MTLSFLAVRPISAAEHLAFVRSLGRASYLQCPSWARIPPRRTAESVGWFEGSTLRGAALVHYRRVPVVGAQAYVPEGPVVDWSLGAARVVEPLVSYLRERGVFSVKMSPWLVLRRWDVPTLRAAVRAGTARRLREVPGSSVDASVEGVAAELRDLGWQEYEAPGPGFGGTMQPRYRAQRPLEAGAELEAGLDASWRRNVRKASAQRVSVEVGERCDLSDFYRLYEETAERDRFGALPFPLFERMWEDLRGEDPGRLALYLARRDAEPYAAALRMRVGDWDSYTFGGSTAAGRDFRPSNALQWRMLQDAAASGASVYDLRGISDTLDPADPLFGLLRFKLGLGGEAVETVGEWSYPVRRLRDRAVTAYLERRTH